MIPKRIEKIVSLLKKVAEGKLDPDQALIEWGDVDQEQDELIASSWHELTHFADDDDIREKDKEYEVYQQNLLKDYAKRIFEKYS
ncbi:MAG: hypothetical protein NPINA01_31350 [Nitrospinaceae bacterium]|nr:MAG: hypothetical protein NPINA01_31350 [Nitrospinaceae bacterium]